MMSTRPIIDTWEKNYQNGRYNEYPYDKIISFVARHYYSCERKNVKAIDLGCGGGNNTFFLCEKGFDVYAIDGSEKSVEITQNMLAARNLSANIQLADFCDMPFENDYFDFAIDRQSISYNKGKDVIKIFAEVQRVLKKGGRYIGVLNNSSNEMKKHGEKIDEYTYHKFIAGIFKKSGVVFFTDQNRIKSIFEGFDVESVLHYPVYDILGNNELVADELVIVATKI